MAKTVSKTAARRRQRRTGGWTPEVVACQRLLAYWRARMDKLRVGDVAVELGKLEEGSRYLVGWFEQVERAGTVPSDYAKEAFGNLAERERLLAEKLKALREKLGWCFQHEQRG